jgi:hypothetical protein
VIECDQREPPPGPTYSRGHQTEENLKMPKTSNAHQMAFFRRAGEFFSAAEKLFTSESGPMASRRWLYPIYFCYSHAIELVLKAFLRLHSPEVEFGHDLTRIYAACVREGLVIDPKNDREIRTVVAFLDAGNEDAGFRYLFGRGPLPDLTWTREVVGRLIEVVEPHVMLEEEKHPSSRNIVRLLGTISKPTKQVPKA